MRTIACLALFAALLPPALAQEGEKPEKERPKTALERTEEVERSAASAQELLTAAVQRLRARKEFVMRANVQHKQPEADPVKPGNQGQAIQIIVRAQGPGMDSEDPYEGKLELWRDEQGVTVAVSEKEIPGFGLYLHGEKTIRRVTAEDRGPGLRQLQAELLTLLDGERFGKHLLAADLVHRADEATGDHIFRGAISKEVVRPLQAVGKEPAAVMALRMAPRVLRAEVELRLSKDGKLKRTSVTVVRNDPAREMLRGGFGKVVIRGGQGGIQIPDQNPGDKEKHEIEGVSTTYTLDLSKAEPSERAKAFKREIQRALSE